MELPTYTGIWRIEKRLYRLYDFKLPAPIGLRTAGIALSVFLGWILFLLIIGFPFIFGNGWLLVVWVVPPGVITVVCTRSIAQGKRLPELAWSYAKFVYQGRMYVRGRRHRLPSVVRYSLTVWTHPGTLAEAAAPAVGPEPPSLERPGAARTAAAPAPVRESAHPPPRPLVAAPKIQARPRPVPVVVDPEPASTPPVAARAEPDLEPAPPVDAVPEEESERPPAVLVLVMGCASGSGQTTTARAMARSLPAGAGPVAVVDFAPRHARGSLASAPDVDAGQDETAAMVRLTLPLAEDTIVRGPELAALLAPILHRYPVVVLDPPSTITSPLLMMVDQLVMTSTNDQAGVRDAILSTEWLRSAGHEVLCDQALIALIPTTPHPADPMLSAATAGTRDLYAPAWDEGVRGDRAPSADPDTYRALAVQALASPAHT